MLDRNEHNDNIGKNLGYYSYTPKWPSWTRLWDEPKGTLSLEQVLEQLREAAEKLEQVVEKLKEMTERWQERQ